MPSRYKNRSAAALLAAVLMLNAPAALAAPQELALKDSIAAAVSNNPALKMADADKERAAWGVDEAAAGRWPTLSLGSTYSRQPDSGRAPASEGVSNSLRLNWQLYNGGRTAGLVDQAEEGLRSAALGVTKAEQQVRLDAAAAYFAVLQNKNLVAVNEESVENLRQHLKTAQAKFDVGLVAKADILRSEVELANAEQNLIKSKNSYELALASLKNVMSMDPAAEIALTDALKYEKYGKTLDESVAIARENRPEIQQAAAGVNMATSGVKVAESGNLPTVTFGASKGWNDSALPDSGGDWTVSLTANWNVFDAGVTKAKVRQADAGLSKAREQARQTEDAVELEVRQQYLSMQEAEKRLDTTEVAIAKAEEDLGIAREKYDAGVGTNIDVIDAQLALAQARTNYYQALYDFNVSKAKLTRAVGLPVE
ncbi:TolC family protein [Anaeroselena agilis]|uniref:TolC family protein n=1 Tax=Anaeroselena agilis TaxID=3063788 RepID=A0ABU3P0G3_9FIRM|nr:TolC family protein [Selenomonadales bacterium 4137-cl]